jgi:hypothetical protein
MHSTRNYRQYSFIADLHTLQFIVTHALGFSVFTSRILATDCITVSLSLKITHEVFFWRPNSFLAIVLQLPTPKTWLSSIPLLPSSCPGRLASRNSTLLDYFSIEPLFITILHGPRREHDLSIVGKVCLQRHFIATEVTRSLLAYSLPREYIYRLFA